MNRPERFDVCQAAAQDTWTWPGLGLWNLYFIIKLALLWGGYLNMQILPNLVFAAVLLVPLRNRYLALLRTLIALPLGVALFYQDTWLPPFSRLLDQPGVLNFTGDYLLELAGRFIDWNLCGALLLLVVAYFFVRQWLRLDHLDPGRLCLAGRRRVVGHACAGSAEHVPGSHCWWRANRQCRAGQPDARRLPAKVLQHRGRSASGVPAIAIGCPAVRPAAYQYLLDGLG